MHYIIYAELQSIYYVDSSTATGNKLIEECHAESASMHLDYIIKFADKLIEILLHSERLLNNHMAHCQVCVCMKLHLHKE